MDQLYDSWSVKEKLALASAVSAEGKNWESVGTRVKSLLEEYRPSDWNSPDNCALQYNSIIESVCSSKKKRGASLDDAHQVALKKLRSERIEELRSTVDRAKNAYMKLKEQIESLQDGLQNHRLQEIWAEITREKSLKQEKDEARMKLLEEREKKLKEISEIKVEETAPVEDFVEMPDVTSVDEKAVILQEDMANEEVVELVTEEVEIAPTEYEISIEGNDYAVPMETSMAELEMPAVDVTELSHEKPVEEPAEVSVAQEEALPVEETEPVPSDDQIAVAFNLLENSNPEFAFKTPPSTPKKETLSAESVSEGPPGSPELTDRQPALLETNVQEGEVSEALETEPLPRTPPRKASPQKGRSPPKKISPVKQELEPETPSEPKLSPKKGKTPRKVKRGGRKASETESETEQTSVTESEKQLSPVKTSELRKSPYPVKKSPEKKVAEEAPNESEDENAEQVSEQEAAGAEPSSPVREAGVSEAEEEREVKEETLADANPSATEVEAEPTEKQPTLEATTEEESRDERDLKVWRKSILLVWKDLCLHKNSSIFMKPISDEKVKGYSIAVKRPMDLSTIKKNIDSGAITTTTEFYRDVMLMFANAMMFNSSQSNIYEMALDMQKDAMEIIQNYIHTQLILQADGAKSPPPEKESPPAPPQPSAGKKGKKAPAVSTPQSNPDTKRRRTTRNSENL